ncbi:MAG: MFS transporter, partial [Rhodococcus sp. (in: high G+C Gram-positive bacteria)]
TFTTSAMNILQMSVPSDMRGRVMGIYMLCFLGGAPLGSPVLGLLADVLDPRAPLLIGGVVSLATGLFAAVYLLRHNNLRLSLSRPAAGHRIPVLDVLQIQP